MGEVCVERCEYRIFLVTLKFFPYMFAGHGRNVLLILLLVQVMNSRWSLALLGPGAVSSQQEVTAERPNCQVVFDVGML